MSAIIYRCRVHPRGDGPIVEFTTTQLSFVNDESYGKASNFGITEATDDAAMVNLAHAVAVEVTVEDEDEA